MARASVAILGDAASFLRAVRQSVGGARQLGVAFTDLGVDAKRSAQVQVAAAVKRDAAARAQVAAFRQVAASSPRGSREQVAATNLANAAQLRVARGYGVTAREAERLRKSATGVERDVGRASRGLLAGSGAVRGLGRSLAFASTTFIGFSAGAGLLKASIDAARSYAATQRQLATQLKANGESWAQYRGQVEQTTLKLSDVSGFTREDLLGSLTQLDRSTGSVTSALRLESVAADVARGRHISLQAAAIALGKAWGGSTSALQRLGLVLPKGVSGFAAINTVAARFAGQAKAGATASDRFNVILRNSEETIGTALLPTVNHAVASFGQWLQKMNESGRLQRDVNTGVRAGTTVFKAILTVIRTVDRVTGSFLHTLELLAAFKFASLIGRWATSLSQLAGTWRKVTVAANEAKTAEAAASLGPAAAALAALLAGNAYRNFLTREAKDIKAQQGGNVVVKTKSGLREFALGAGRVAGVSGYGTPGLLQGVRAAKEVVHALTTAAGTAHGGGGGLAGARALGLAPGTGAPANVLAQLQVAAARAAATGSRAQVVAAAREIVGKLQAAIPHLQGSQVVQALRLEGTERGIINKADKAAAKVSADAARKAAEAAKKQTEAAAKLGDAAQKAANAADKQIGALFQGPVLAPTQEQTLARLGAPGPTASKLVEDLKAQTQLFVGVQSDIKRIQQRGAPPELVRELRKLGVNAALEIHSLATANGSTFKAYLRQFAVRERAAATAAAITLKTPKVSVQAQHVLIQAGNTPGAAATAAKAGNAPTHIHLHIDGKEAAKAILPHLQNRGDRHIGLRSGRYAGRGMVR